MLRSDEITRYTITARFTTQRSTLRAIALFCTMQHECMRLVMMATHSARTGAHRSSVRGHGVRGRAACEASACVASACVAAAGERACQRCASASAGRGAVRQQQCAEGDVQQRLTVGLHAFMLVLRAMKERDMWL